MVIVLVTTGKHESVDTAKVKLFFDKSNAREYVTENTKPGKYWMKAEIVDVDEQVELNNIIE